MEAPILQGMVGSTAYGLSTPDSDVDRLAVHIADPYDVMTFGLSKGQMSRVRTDPDLTSHDIGKYLSLVVKGNPTVTELLWLPTYEFCNDWGLRLIELRARLLGARAVKDSYGGYAMQQITRLKNRNGSFSSDTDKRKGKHARHCFRLLIQGEHLLKTGEVRIQLTDGEKRLCWYASDLAESGEIERLDQLFESYNRAFLEAYAKTHLPEQVDTQPVRDIIFEARAHRLILNPKMREVLRRSIIR